MLRPRGFWLEAWDVGFVVRDSLSPNFQDLWHLSMCCSNALGQSSGESTVDVADSPAKAVEPRGTRGCYGVLESEEKQSLWAAVVGTLSLVFVRAVYPALIPTSTAAVGCRSRDARPSSECHKVKIKKLDGRDSRAGCSIWHEIEIRPVLQCLPLLYDVTVGIAAWCDDVSSRRVLETASQRPSFSVGHLRGKKSCRRFTCFDDLENNTKDTTVAPYEWGTLLPSAPGSPFCPMDPQPILDFFHHH